MHIVVLHGTQINKQAELVICVKLFHVYVLRSRTHTEVPLGFFPNVHLFKTIVVKLVGRAVHGDADFFQVGIDILF